MFSLLFYIRQLNAKIYQGTAWRDALISVIGLYHIHIYLHFISDNYSLHRHRTWYMHWKADTRAYIVIITLWDGMSRILLIDILSLTKYLTSRFKKDLKEKNNKWHHHHHHLLWIQLFRLWQKIDLKCKWFHQKKVFTTCRVRGQIIFIFSYILYYAIEKKRNIWSFFLIILFLLFFLIDKCFSFS
jgi:hypothetical protein